MSKRYTFNVEHTDSFEIVVTAENRDDAEELAYNFGDGISQDAQVEVSSHDEAVNVELLDSEQDD